MRGPRLVCVGVLLLAAAHAAYAQQAAPVLEQQPPPVAPQPPVPLAMNGQLTNWLRVRSEFRERTEGFAGGGFSGTNNDAYWMDRSRFDATVRPAKSLAFFIQAQDARAFDKTTGGMAAPFRDTLNLHQAYGESALRSTTTLRIGRQELAFGEQRLLGSLGWANVARTFDAARLTIKQPIGQFDAFAASVVTITPDAFDKSGNGIALYGTYESLTGIVPKQAIEPYFLWRESSKVATKAGSLAELRQSTTGIRIAGRLPLAFDYSTEMAIQRRIGRPRRYRGVGRSCARRPLVLRTFQAADVRGV